MGDGKVMGMGKKGREDCFSAFLMVCAVCLLTGASPIWEGAGAVAPYGALPERGFYIASNTFPKNTVVDVFNPATGLSIQAIVASSQNMPGGLALLSRDASTAIGLPADAVGRIRIASPADPGVANSRFLDGRSISGDPDYDPASAVKSYVDPNDFAVASPSARWNVGEAPSYAVLDGGVPQSVNVASERPEAPEVASMYTLPAAPSSINIQGDMPRTVEYSLDAPAVAPAGAGSGDAPAAAPAAAASGPAAAGPAASDMAEYTPQIPGVLPFGVRDPSPGVGAFPVPQFAAAAPAAPETPPFAEPPVEPPVEAPAAEIFENLAYAPQTPLDAPPPDISLAALPAPALPAQAAGRAPTLEVSAPLSPRGLPDAAAGDAALPVPALALGVPSGAAEALPAPALPAPALPAPAVEKAPALEVSDELFPRGFPEAADGGAALPVPDLAASVGRALTPEVSDELSPRSLPAASGGAGLPVPALVLEARVDAPSDAQAPEAAPFPLLPDPRAEDAVIVLTPAEDRLPPVSAPPALPPERELPALSLAAPEYAAPPEPLPPEYAAPPELPDEAAFEVSLLPADHGVLRPESGAPPELPVQAEPDVFPLPADHGVLRPESGAPPELPGQVEPDILLLPVQPQLTPSLPAAPPVVREPRIAAVSPPPAIREPAFRPQAPQAPQAPAVVPEPLPRPAVSDSLKRINALEKGKYYIQMGIFNGSEEIDRTLLRLRKNLPAVIQNAGADGAPTKLLLGPMNEGESNALLVRLKKDGWKDVFIKSGT
jgi:hypothetical protein